MVFLARAVSSTVQKTLRGLYTAPLCHWKIFFQIYFAQGSKAVLDCPCFLAEDIMLLAQQVVLLFN